MCRGTDALRACVVMRSSRNRLGRLRFLPSRSSPRLRKAHFWENPCRWLAGRHAVFATLREAVTTKEFFDVTVQLPDEYWTLIPGP